MRASRLVSLLLLLQTRGRMTAQALAGELEVSVRTIYRDVESLHSAGVPIYGDAGPTGGYQLVDGYRTLLTGLTGEEAESLFLAGLPGPAGFDLVAHWRDSLDAFQTSRHTSEAVIRLSPRGVERFPDNMIPAVARAAEETATPQDDGWVRAVIPIESVDHAVGQLLKLGTDVEVLEPAGLRDRMAGTVRGLAEIYWSNLSSSGLVNTRCGS